MKTVKYVLYAVGALIVLALVAVGIFAATFDPNQYKDDITRLVKEKKDRTLTIPGNIKLALFPKLGMEIGAATLSEYKSDKIFLRLGRGKLYLSVLPLLRKDLVIDQIEVEGLSAAIVKGRDGKFNFEDLLSREPDREQRGQVKFDAQGFDLANAGITYRDDATGQTAALSGVNLSTGRLANGVPSQFILSASLEGDKPALKARLDLAGELTFDLSARTWAVKDLDGKISGSGFGFTDVSAVLKGTARADPGRKAVDASDLDISVSGGYKHPGTELSGAQIKLAAATLKLDTDSLAVSTSQLRLDAHGNYNQHPFEIKLAAPSFNADGKKLAVQAEKIELQAKGGQGGESGSVALDAAKIDADLSAQRIAVENLNASGAGAMPGIVLSGFEARLPRLLLNLEANQIVADGVLASASGKQGEDSFDVAVSAPRLAVSKESASGDAVTGAVKLGGKYALDMKFSVADVKGLGKALSIGKVTLDIAKAQLGATALSGSLSTALSANLEEQIFELAKIDASLTVANPQMPMKSLKLPITGSARADLGKQSAGFDIATRFDDSSITARAGVVRFSQPVINFDINIDRLDVDRYFPPQAAPAGKGGGAKAAAGAGKPIDLSALKGLNANGTLKIGALQVNNIKAANVVLTLKAAGGRVAVKPLGAALYQGKLAGTLGADASNPGAYAAWQTFTMVNFSH